MWITGKMLVLIFVSVLSTVSSIESNFYGEEKCLSKNGYCVLEKECPHAITEKFKNYCPNQQSAGAVCCENFPVEDLNCFQTHNECRKTKDCPKHLNSGQKGCEGGKICCVLV